MANVANSHVPIDVSVLCLPLLTLGDEHLVLGLRETGTVVVDVGHRDPDRLVHWIGGKEQIVNI